MESAAQLVSVIIIFLNAEKYLEEAISSVFAQSYVHWELLLCDDGSSDASTAIAKRFAAKSPGRVRYLEHPGHQNRGMSATRNLGVAHARGVYVALLDADDVWLPHKLSQQVPLLDRNPQVGMVYAPTEYWYSWESGVDRSRDYLPPLGLPSHSIVRPPTMLLRFLTNQAKPPGTCSVLMRREVITGVGGFVDEFRGMYEDQAFFAKVSLNVPVYVVPEATARYRQHAESECSVAAAAGRYRAAEDRYLRWLARYLDGMPQQSGAEWDELHQLLWPYRHPVLRRLRAASAAVGNWIPRT